MFASLTSSIAEASDSALLTVLERTRSSSSNPTRSPLSRQSEKNDRESLRWNVVGFHTNLYLFALASNLLPSTKASSKGSPISFAAAAVTAANTASSFGEMTLFMNLHSVEWSGLACCIMAMNLTSWAMASSSFLSVALPVAKPYRTAAKRRW